MKWVWKDVNILGTLKVSGCLVNEYFYTLFMYCLGPHYIAVGHARSRSALFASNVNHIKVARHRHTRRKLHGEKPEDVRGKNMGKAGNGYQLLSFH